MELERDTMNRLGTQVVVNLQSYKAVLLDKLLKLKMQCQYFHIQNKNIQNTREIWLVLSETLIISIKQLDHSKLARVTQKRL